jgi:hypothetical protein
MIDNDQRASFIAVQAIAVARPTHMIPRLVVGSLINKVLSSSEDSCGSLVTEVVLDLVLSY